MHDSSTQGTCPKCNTENFTYFGDVLTVSGSRDEQSMKCKECKSNLTFKANTRMVRHACAECCKVQCTS